MAVKSRKPKKQTTTFMDTRSDRPSAKSKSTSARENDHRNGSLSAHLKSLPKSVVFGAVVMASVFGILHSIHISSMFENDRFFSHLSDLEREMTFRTEMGLYYSYYKAMVNSPSFLSGLQEIMNDNITEYPSTINVLKRFNLYPEVALAAGYRLYDGITKKLGIVTRQCYTVNRGRGLSSVLNCEGMGDIAVFYVNAIFAENGLLLSTMFLLASYLSGSLLGGIVTVAAFFYNHGECTRVQWTPPLRESMAYPVFVLQMFLVTHTLRHRQPGWTHSLLIAVATTGFMLPWQFAQFALMTQTLAVCASYILGYTSHRKLRCVVQGQSLGLVASYILLFGNEMLLTSFFASCLIAVWGMLLIAPLWKHKSPHPLVTIGMEGAGLLVLMLSCKVLLSRLLSIQDDAHIGNLFRSKFSNYRDFHTMLYTCAAEFDFMETQTPVRYLKTLLLPTSVFAFVGTVVYLVRQEIVRRTGLSKSGQGNGKTSNTHEQETSNSENGDKPHAELVYHLFQLMAFTVMAIIIMRLKLFLTPHLCLISSLLASRQIFGWLGDRMRHAIVLTLLLSLMSIAGVANLQHQWSIRGDFSNAPQEEMLEWVKANTPQNAVFAGPMPTMASIKLSTLRPIVNHPHYEDAGLRARTKVVYGMYSRKPAQEVYGGIRALKADFVVLEHSWCVRRSGPGCSLPEIWDIEDQENAGEEPLCLKLHRNAAPYFREVYRNDVYTILKL
ncbi:probable C-mannosyltransferase DPY19L1 [Acanthaster planci]|uniref:Probable C-mannosyltransferase DPY19L1 n=1 Tax=Acanthaster planci TaxID=133434 RepID=A0A8B7ZGG5_ACAPL|nr:probable C-mannosyltransferase DPY19L1 [Acanthaster planci]